MKLYCSQLLSLLLCLAMYMAHASPSAIKLNKNQAAHIGIMEDESCDLSPEQAYLKYIQGNFKLLKGNNYNAGFTKSVYWLILQAAPDQDSVFFVLGNAHINDIMFYHIVSGKPVFNYQTGDHFKFSQRPLKCRLFVFPLGRNITSSELFLVRVDKHNESLQINTDVLNRTGFYSKIANYNLINGILSGAVILLIAFGLFLFITVHDPLYLYYVLYLLIMYLWVIADKGYGYQYLWPDSAYFASRARPFFNSLMNIFALHFMQIFIGQDSKSKLFRPILYLKTGLGLLGGLFLIPVSSAYYHNATLFLLLIMLVLSACTCAAILLSILEKIRQGNKQAWFYLMSIAALIVFGLAEVFVHAGSEEVFNSYLSAFGIQTGLIIEAIILTFGLAHRFNSYRLDRKRLLVDINRKQEEITTGIITTQENERKKISDQLHDDVGAMLSIATWQVNAVLSSDVYADEKVKEKLQRTGQVLEQISQTIRTLSHTLSPWAIEKYGLNKAVTELVYNINLSEKVSIEFIVVGFESTDAYPIYFLNDIYRVIQELLNNILKHSEASNACLQLIEHDELISLIVEDNGRGIATNSSKTASGIGLASVRSKIACFKGKIEIKSDHGTLIVIEIPRLSGDSADA